MSGNRGKSGPPWGFAMASLMAAAVVAAPLACSPGSGDAPGTFTARDSAGIRIVESLRPVWEGGEGWRVGEEPLLRIGSIEGEAAYQFSQVAGVARLPDGGFLVGDEASQEMRFFDSVGRHLRTVGRRGEGPGEFTGLSGVGVGPRGRAWAYDFFLRRITWFSPEGEVAGLTSLALEPPTLSAEGPLPDGTFLFKQLWGTGGNSEANSLGLQRDPLAWVTFQEEGALADTVATVPGRELFVFEENGRGVMSTPPFARNSVGTIRGDRIVVGDQEEYQVEEFASSGALLRILRIPGRVEPVTSERLEDYIQGRLASAPPQRHPSLRQSLAEMPHSETLPAYGDILSDSSGNLWVGEWTVYPEMARSWSVFDTEGRWLGEVEVPDRFSPWVIGEEWVLGIEKDELDVEYVVLYPLERRY